MIMFVTTAEDPSGALVPIRLPEGVAVLDLVDPPSYMRRFQLRWSDQHMPTPRSWLTHPAREVHGWKTAPTIDRIHRALRRPSGVPDDVMTAAQIDEWAKAHGIAGADTVWHRRRRTPLRAVSSMSDEALMDAVYVVSREAAERVATDGDHGREWDPLVNGRLLSSFTPDELDHLFVAIDWHRSGRPPIGAGT